jgi:hypothetical protein
MQYALFVVAKTDDDNYDKDKWRTLRAAVRGTARKALESCQLSENVWLIPLGSESPLLGELIGWCGQIPLHYQILFFPEEPEWVYSPKHPLAEDAKTQ